MLTMYGVVGAGFPVQAGFMRPLATVVSLLLLLAACGGGGGDATTQTPDDTPADNAQTIESILGSCGSDDVGQALGIQDVLLDLFGGGTQPDITITGFNLVQAQFSWSLDQNADQQADLIGSTQFRDANGNPTLPVANPQDLADALAGDLTALAALIQEMPQGTQIATTYNGTPAGLTDTSISGNVTVHLGAAGTLSTTSGSYTSQTGVLCASQIDWESLDVSGVATGGQPVGVLDIAGSSPEGALDGTLTLDGTNTGLLEVSVDSAPAASYTLDLTTGDITPVAG